MKKGTIEFLKKELRFHGLPQGCTRGLGLQMMEANSSRLPQRMDLLWRFWNNSQDLLESLERSRILGILEALSSRNDLKGFGGAAIDQLSFKMFFSIVSHHSKFTFPGEILMGLILHLVTWGGQCLFPGRHLQQDCAQKRENSPKQWGWVGGHNQMSPAKQPDRLLANNFNYLRCAEQREIHGQEH